MSLLIHATLFVALFCILVPICSASSNLLNQTLTSTGEFVLENGQTFYIPNVHREDEPQVKLSMTYFQVKSSHRVNSTTRNFTMDQSNSQYLFNMEFSIFQLNQNATEYLFEFNSALLQMCLHYGFNNASWYNAYQRDKSKWPIDSREAIPFPHSHEVKLLHWAGERYSILENLHINSDGFALLLDSETPYEMFRSTANNDPIICFVLSSELRVRLYTSSNIRTVADFVVRHSGRIRKPTSIPAERLFKETIWYTGWNQSLTLDLANKVKQHEFFNSTFVVNSIWKKDEEEIGLDLDRFPNANEMIENLHKQEIKVCLQVHAFMTMIRNSSIAKTTIKWTNNYIKITKDDFIVFEWFSTKYKKLYSETNADCFVISSYINPRIGFDPNEYFSHYIKTVYNATVASVSSWFAYRTQHLPMFLYLNMYSTSYEAFLQSIIPRALSVSIAGYSYFTVTIGSNANGDITEEIFIRTVQASALMPSMAFGKNPWDFSEKTLELTKRYVELHSQFVPTMIELAKKRVTDGSPIIRPMWHVAPDDSNTYLIDDQFMLGDDILVAPVVSAGKRYRRVYLPVGNWIDHVGQNFSGPAHLTLAVPLETLLYFKRID